MSIFFLPIFVCVAVSAPPARAFSVHGRTPKSLSVASLTSLQYKSAATTDARNETGVTMESGKEGGWSLDTDWLLEDAVPRYTVTSSSSDSNGSSQRRVTFWSQLRHANSAFADMSEAEIEERFRTLHRADAPLHCGPAPPTLTDWWVDDTKRMMGGTDTANGADVWFYIQSGGRVLGNGIPMSIELRYAPGGFVEAKNGLIWELGPTAITASTTAPAPLESPVQEMASGTHQNRDFKILEAFYNSGTNRFSADGGPSRFLADSARHTRKMLLVAIVASSVLSATLAYGIGQGIGQQVPLRSSLPPDAVTVRVQMLPSCPRPTAAATTATAPRPEPTVQERRARQELRLIREKKTQQYLEDAIQRDEQKLWDLQREETRQEGAALGF